MVLGRHLISGYLDPRLMWPFPGRISIIKVLSPDATGAGCRETRA